MSEGAPKETPGWRPPALARAVATVQAAGSAPEPDPSDARQQAYDAGYAEGLAAGRARGESIAAEMTALRAAMAAPFRDSEVLLLRELLALVEKTVQAVLDREVEIAEPDLELTLSEALKVLGTVQVPVEISLHPVDAALCRELGLAEEPDMSIVEDERIHRGGLKLQAGSTIVDATVEARLEEVLAGLRVQAGVPEPARSESAPIVKGAE